MNPEKMSKKELMELVNNLRMELVRTNTPSSHGAFGEDLYKLLAQISQVGFYIMQDKYFKFINSHFRDYTGYTEEEMLRKFWELAERYQVFITFNGRAFDMPFIIARSAIKGIRPTKDLMRGRYLYQNNPDALHIDLLEQLSFYGATRRKGSLHLWSRAFGIPSPKSGGVTGDDVGPLFKKKKFLEIAKYNVGDIRATRLLYEKWEKYLSF